MADYVKIDKDKQKKRGRFGKDEEKFIRENHTKLTVDQLAEELNREFKTVKNQIVKMGLTRDDDGNMTYEVGFELKNRHYYKGLQKQFTVEELETFENEWCHIVAQFNNDVLHTEEMQIVESIKYGIMMDRCLQEQYELNQEITAKQARLSEMEGILRPTADEDAEMQILLNDIGAAQASRDAAMKSYVSFQKEKNTLLQKIRGVREDRVKTIENKADTFATWITQLATNKKLRKELGEYMEKSRLAAIDEEVRLAAYHKYEDEKIDQVLLTPETVKDDNVTID